MVDDLPNDFVLDLVIGGRLPVPFGLYIVATLLKPTGSVLKPTKTTKREFKILNSLRP